MLRLREIANRVKKEAKDWYGERVIDGKRIFRTSPETIRRLPKRIHRLLPGLLQRIFWFPAHLILLCFGKKRSVGLENLRLAQKLSRKRSVGVIIVSNHSNELDPFLMVSTILPWSRLLPVYLLSRTKDLYDHYGPMRHLFGGRLFWIFGTYPAIFGLSNYKEALPYHTKILEEGRTVAIFPEGGIPDDAIPEARGGVGYLVMTTRAIVVPMTITGTPRQSENRQNQNMRVCVGKPIIPEELFNDNDQPIPETCKRIARLIMDKVYQPLLQSGSVVEENGVRRYVSI